MRTILCFGDSNTYGESPEGGGRYPRDARWTGLLQKALGDDYYVIEEGLNGRTTVWDDPIEGDKSGLRHLPVSLATHAPLDLVVIMLGSNDLKRRFSVTPADIALGAERLVKLALAADNEGADAPPEVLLVSPAHIRHETFLGEVFGDRRADTLRFGPLFEAAAKRQNVHFLDIAPVAEPSEKDGLHFDRQAHKLVAKAMERKIRGIFGA